MIERTTIEADGLTFQVVDSPSVTAGVTAAEIAASGVEPPEHDCDANAVPYVSDGALGHGFECGICGAFLQAG